MKSLNLLLILSFLILSNLVNAQFCTTDNRFTEQTYFSDNQITSRLNVRYATAVDWLGNSVDLRMDVYFPKLGVDPMPQRPFIMMIHGGGFQGGSKEVMTNYCEEFAKRGFVAATINYRLGWTPGNKLEQVLASYRAQQDAHAALRFVVRNANRVRIDTDWLFIGGSSAGSVTSLNTIYITEEEWEAEVPGITTLLGPLNTSGNKLTNTFELQGIFNNWGMTLDNGIDPEEMLPSVAFHGVLDQTTPIGTGPGFPGGPVYSGSGAIHDYLLANNICSELTVDSMGGHGIYRGDAGEEFRVSRATCFFKSVFCDDCASNFFTDSVAANCSVDLSAKIGLAGVNTRPTAFAVFPNPTSDLLNIQGVLENHQIDLINTSGQVVRHIEYVQLSTSMDVSDLASGLYLLRVVNLTDKSVEVKKILIQ